MYNTAPISHRAHSINEIQKGCSTTNKNNLVSNQRRCTVKDFNLYKAKISSLSTMSFPIFQTAQKIQKEPTYYTLLLSFSIPLHP